jgi:hypothetical protein
MENGVNYAKINEVLMKPNGVSEESALFRPKLVRVLDGNQAHYDRLGNEHHSLLLAKESNTS